MNERLVLDASAALALLRREPLEPEVRRLLGRRGEILVPEHFWLEIVNALVRRHRWLAEAVVAAVYELDELDLTTAEIDRPTLLLALDHAIEWGLTAYDAAYLALADATDAQLLTLDADLAAAAGARAAPLGESIPARRRLSETAAPYGQPIDWARFGPYLAKLRAEARA